MSVSVSQAALDPGAEMGHRAEGDQGRLVGHGQLVAERRQRGGDRLHHVAVLGAALGRAGEIALGIGVGAGGVAPRHGPGQRVARHARPCRAIRSSGVAPKNVPSGMGMEKMVQSGSWARSRRRTADRGSGPLRRTVTGGTGRPCAGWRPGAPMAATASAHHGAVARRGHGGSPVSPLMARRRAGAGGRRAVLPDDRVEELVGVGQRRRRPGRPRWPSGGSTPSASRGDAHGEAGDDELAREGVGEGERPERHHARARAPHGVVTGDGGQGAPPPRRPGPAGRAPADQGQPGAVEEHGGAAVELQGVGPVLERHGAGVQRARSRRRGAPARVATISWLRPPARGRIPTAE